MALEDIVKLKAFARLTIRVHDLAVSSASPLDLVNLFVSREEQVGNILFEGNKSNERHEVHADLILERLRHLEELNDVLVVQQFQLALNSRRFNGKLDSELNFVCIIVHVDESIVEEESRVALLAI